MSAWIFLILTMSVAIAPFLPFGHATAKNGWISQHFQDHSLIGAIWTSDFEAVTVSELEKALANARFVSTASEDRALDGHKSRGAS